MTASINTNGKTAGMYYANITITSDDGDEGTIKIPVTLDLSRTDADGDGYYSNSTGGNDPDDNDANKVPAGAPQPQSSIIVSSLQTIYSNGTYNIFEFIVENNGDTNLQNISWTFKLGNGVTINSTQNISLASGESAFVYVQYNYSSQEEYTVNATVRTGNLTDSATLNLYSGDLLITDLSEIYSSSFNRIYEFTIRNNGSTTLSNINWTLNTEETTFYAKNLLTLNSSEEIPVLVKYTFTGTGDFLIIATAFNTENSYEKTLTTSIKPLDVSDLKAVYSSGNRRIFEFNITNIWNVALPAINWSVNFGNAYKMNSSALLNLSAYNNTFIYIDYTYPSSGSYLVNATARNNTVQDSDTININV